jgi:hypothetical protein
MIFGFIPDNSAVVSLLLADERDRNLRKDVNLSRRDKFVATSPRERLSTGNLWTNMLEYEKEKGSSNQKRRNLTMWMW